MLLPDDHPDQPGQATIGDRPGDLLGDQATLGGRSEDNRKP